MATTDTTVVATGGDMRRADIEAWLDERHVPWTYDPKLPVGDVDQVASLGNQARLEPLSEEVVDRYQADMERGDQFPPIVARRHGKRLILIGGNHRLAAALRANLPTVAAYVTTCAPEMAVRLTYEDNRRHGFAPSEEERLYQAVHLVNTGYSQAEAAEVTGVHPSKVNRAVALNGADTRATAAHINGWARMAKTTRWRLDAIRSDPVFEAAAQLCADTNMTSSDVYELVTKLNNTRSEKAALHIVAVEVDARAHDVQETAGGLIRKTTPRTKLLGALTTITGLDGRDIAASCATPDQAAALSRQIGTAVTMLQSFAKAL